VLFEYVDLGLRSRHEEDSDDQRTVKLHGVVDISNLKRFSVLQNVSVKFVVVGCRSLGFHRTVALRSHVVLSTKIASTLSPIPVLSLLNYR